MYPQFAENPAMRGLPDMARSRLPYPPYYTPKLPEGMPYVGGQRPSLPYGGGKPIPPHDPMYGPWNTMMMSQGMMSVPKQMNKPEYGFPGQTDIYGRPYPPDPMMGGGYPTHGYPSSYSPYPTYPPHPGIPSHIGDGYTPERPNYQPQNNVWNTETGPVNSPSRTWPTQQQQQEMMTSSEIPRPPSAFQGSPQPAALSSDLQKGSSMTSLKDALVNPPCTLPDSNKYQFNSSYLSVGGDARDHASPHTPSNARTPDPITPGRSGLLGNNNGMSPLSSTNNDNNIATRPSQTSPFEVEAILGIKESTENGESFINSKTIKSISPTSPAGSPHTKKVRSPIFSPVNRHHQSFSSQYNLSDEPGRRDFLDALFKYMEQEGIPFLRPPTMNKNTLDLFKTFTAVQSLGGFTHVVNKRLWKDVAKSSNNSLSSPSSVLLKTLSEYYVKVLLPYECHFTRTNIQDCLSHYELSHRVGGDNVVPNDDSVSDILADNLQDDRKSTTSLSQDLTLLDNNNTNQDNLLVFSEDSQGSLEGFSNQPLPDISVQEAESVLGISTTSAGPTTPSPSYPSYHRGTPEWPANPPDPSRDMMPPYQASPPTGSYPPYFDYGHYSRRQYMSRGYPNMEDNSAYSYPPHLPNMMGRVEDYQSFNHPSMNTGEWSSWPHPQMQARPRLPPPLPPHLQSMMFTPPSQSPHPPPLPSSPVLPPQHIDNTSQALDPIKIMVNEQGLPPDKSTPPPPLPSKPVINQDMKVADKVTDKATPPLSAPVKQELPVIPVETIQPQLVKRRRLNCDHCGHVEPWRVMMSLKCGLPAESTWALDTLSILLHDDRTVGFFYLKHHHSLLNTLVDHFTNCLVDIFGAPFEMLAKYDTPDDEVLPGSDRPVPLASIYHHTDKDIRLGYSDHICHVVTSTPLIDAIPVREPVSHPLTRQRCFNTQQIDETSLLELLKRDALTERILLHMKTPRRLMARSPIQKYFLSPPSSNEIVDDESLLVTSPKQSQYKHTHQENEVIKEEPLPLWTIPSQLEALQKRTLCISNILRSLSFIPGNDMEFSQHPGLLTILGHLLLLHHVHLQSKDRQYTNYKDDEVTPPTIQEDYWWWSCLEVLRENVFVILANIAGQLDLSVYPEVISYPLINGLLHWLVCPSSLATDPLPDTAMVYSLSPQRLVVEALAKMSISEVNVDYILATPPLPRLDLVYSTLLHFISQKKHPAVRQFALVFLSNLAQGGEGASRMIGQQKMTLPLLLECIESSVNASPPTTTTSSKSRTYLHYTDDLSSLSLAMLRRAVITLHCLAKVPINRVSFLPYCNRLLALSMSDVLDPSLTSTLSDVLYELSRLL